MAKVMLIGAGGVAGVAAAKMAQNPDAFGELLIASRTKARCDAIAADIERRRALEDRQEHARKILKNYYNSNSNATDAKKLKKPQTDRVLQEALNVMADMCSSVVYQK